MSPAERRELPGARVDSVGRVAGECQIRVDALRPRRAKKHVPRPRNALRVVPPSRARVRQTAEDGGLSLGHALNGYGPTEDSLRADGISALSAVMQVGLAALLAGLPMEPGHAPFKHADAVDGMVTGLGRRRAGAAVGGTPAPS